jgi:hypothetical protein
MQQDASRAVCGVEHDAMHAMIFGHVTTQVARCAALFSLADHLARGPATAAEIAYAERLDPASTDRLMRACAAFGLLALDASGAYSATELLATLRRDVPGSLRDMAIVQGGRGHWAPWGLLDEAVRAGRPQAAPSLGAGVWEYYATSAGADEAVAFTRAMGAMSGPVASEAARIIDTRDVGFALDVGGASGTLLQALMAANPSLRGAVLDLPHVASDTGRPYGVPVIAGDFLEGVPAADLYLLKHVLHDWDDGSCISILRNCRRTAAPGGRLVAIEMLVDDTVNSRMAAQLDLTMMAVAGGRERTLDEYERLFREAEFRLVGATATRTPFSVIEARAC